MEIIYQYFDVLSSTNDWAKAQLPTLKSGTLLCVTAESQTAGRGQYGRAWFSPKGENLYATFGFLTKEGDPLLLTRLLAESMQHILNEYGVSSRIKWPNDLLVHQKKIAGILCERSGPGIVIGIGLNVNMTQEQCATIDQPATSLFAETGTHIPIKEILHKLSHAFASSLS